MKKIVAFFIFILSVLIAHAGKGNGKVTITHLGIQVIRIEVDGKNYTGRDHSVIINNLAPGYHVIKVYRQSERRGGNNNVSTSQRQLIYTGKIRVKPMYHIDIVINRFGKALVDEQSMDSRYSREYGSDEDYVFDRDYRYNDDRRNDNRRDDDRRYDDRRNDDRNNNRNNNNNIIRPMADQPFTSFLETIRNESFENTRINLAKQVADNNYFTTLQVKQVLQLFTFENNRLDMAKYLYRNTTDREYYFQLYDAFTFSRSKEELAAYVQDYK